MVCSPSILELTLIYPFTFVESEKGGYFKIPMHCGIFDLVRSVLLEAIAKRHQSTRDRR